MVKAVCLDAETIAAFAEGRLPASGRAQVVEHLASCEDCAATFAGTLEYVRTLGLGASSRSWNTGLRLAAALLLPVLLGVPAYLYLRSIGGTSSLAPVVAELRPFDARMTGRFPWKPLAPVERSGSAARSESHALLAAAAEIEERARTSPSLENRHELGRAHLLLGELDEAIAVLRSLVQEAPSKAGPLNDLGAALLARGEAKDRPDDLTEASSVIDRALAADPGLREALFNKAVALEKLHLDEQAEKAWLAYLAGAESSPWSDEARARLEKLRKRAEASEWKPDRDRIEDAVRRGDEATTREIVSRRTQETRLWIQDGLLVSWARGMREGRPLDAEQALLLAETLSGALFETTGDRMIPEILASLRRSPDSEALTRGLLAYGAGIERADRSDWKSAMASFEEAESALHEAGVPLDLFASYGVARCLYAGIDWQRGEPRIERVLADAEARGYPALAAMTGALRGVFEARSSRFSESLADYQRSLALFERLHEEENAAFVLALESEVLGFLGDEPSSERRVLQALDRLPRVLAPWRRSVILMHAAIGAGRIGLPDVALRFEDAAVDASARGDALDRADSLQRRASTALELGRPERAREDLAEARLWTARVPDADSRARLEAEFRAADARLARMDRSPERAIALLSDAIDYFSKGKFDARLPDLLLERARALRERGDSTSAEGDLRAGIELLEKHRADVIDAPQRVSYFDTAHRLFDELVSLEIARERPDEALAYLEREKTRDLLDRWQRAPRIDVAELPREIPAGVALIAYGILPDRLLVWAISEGTRQVAQQPIRAEDLAELVRSFRAELESSDAASSPEAGRKLYDLLVVPVLGRIAGAGTWVFVPDQVLHAVPFAALADRRTERFLVQDHPVLVVPSIALFVHATRNRSRASPRTPLSVLAIGDPAFDEDSFPSLRRLPAAAQEAERIAKLYPDSVTLTGALATRAAFLREIERHEVLHFAGHAVTSDADLLRSRLLLAADPERHDSGNLLAQSLYDRSFGRVRLVVLAGCATASGRISRGEGPLSLARPFLAAGVPGVVATLWAIEDASSGALVSELHREIVAGQTPEQALRNAQLAMIGARDPSFRAPRAWAAFQLAGGVAGAHRA